MSKVILLVFLYITKASYAQLGVNSTLQTDQNEASDATPLLGDNGTLNGLTTTSIPLLGVNSTSNNQTTSNDGLTTEPPASETDTSGNKTEASKPSFSFDFSNVKPIGLHRVGTLSVPVPTDEKKRVVTGWHVGVYIKNGDTYSQICGGSLVTKDTAISAAHCFWDESGLMPANMFAVNGAQFDRRWQTNGVVANVSEIIIPPRFRGIQTSFQDDIAVVRFETPLSFGSGVKPLCVNFDVTLERKHLKGGNLATITGYGLTEENGVPSDTLNYQRLPYVDIVDCIESSDPGFIKYLTSDKICAGDQNTGRALCQGDSGGGLIFFEGNSTLNIPYLRGIASTAPRSNNKCNAWAIGSFTRVYNHRTFLRDNIPGLDSECTIVYAKELSEIAKNKSRTDSQNDKRTFGLINIPANISSEEQIAVLNAAQSDITGLGGLPNNKVDDKNTNENTDDKEVDKFEEDELNSDDANFIRTVPNSVPMVGDSSASTHAWHVAVYLKEKIPYEQICGGTLVKTNIVISAASCFVNNSQLLPSEQVAVSAGKLHRPWGDPRDEYAQYSDIEQIRIPDSFIKIDTSLRSCYQHDIAVVTLATPFTYATGVRPACVDFADLKRGSFGKFLGWGSVQDCKPQPNLHSRELPFLNLGCEYDLPLDNGCTGLVDTPGDGETSFKVLAPCATDSGGGLTFLENATIPKPYLRGVATVALPTSKCSRRIVDTFTRLNEEQEFLLAAVPGLKEECGIVYPEFEETIYQPLPFAEKPSTEQTTTTRTTTVKVPVADKLQSNKQDMNGDSPNAPVENGLADKPNRLKPNKLSSGGTNRPEVNGVSSLSGIRFEGNSNPNFRLSKHPTNRPLLSNNKKPDIVITNKTDIEKPADSTVDSLPVPTLGNGTPGFEWHVGIYSKAWDPYMQICGGSLVKSDVVLSAAHCFWSDEFGPQQARDFAVAAGKRHRAWTHAEDKLAQFSYVKDLIIPDRFMGVKTSYQDDIAVVRLASPFEFSVTVKPICMSFMDEKQLQIGSIGLMAGWGLAEQDNRPSQRLHYLQLPYVAVKDCIRQAEPSVLKYVTSDKICAGEQGSGKYLCRSDTGGGLVFPHDKPYLWGISSTTTNFCSPAPISRFTLLASHASFLMRHVGDVEECSGMGVEDSNLYGGGKYTKVEDVGSNPFTHITNLYCNCNCDKENKYRP